MEDRPSIPTDMIEKWQRIVDMLAHLLAVPSGLIMKTDPPDHSVFINSSTQETPYYEQQVFELNTGLYCDTVIQKKSLLVVTDASRDPEWSQNPDMKYNMVFYMGLPLIWPDGGIFGTICVLDSKTNPTAVKYKHILAEFCEVVNSDLQLLTELRTRKMAQHDLQNSHIHLEGRVAKRTKELFNANVHLEGEVAAHKKTEKALLKREAKLEEANVALKVLLERLENSTEELEGQFRQRISAMISPYVSKLKKRISDEPALAFIEILEANIDEITAPVNPDLAAVFSRLTPAEIEVSKLIKQAKSTKEIAELLNVAVSTVDFHRNNIRKKLGISKSRVNLRSFFSSLA